MVKSKACKLCDYIGEETHMHHIVPKSLGGGDDSNNLIELCIPCHNKAHNADFGGDKGIIKRGINGRIDRFKEAKKWLEAHEEVLMSLLWIYQGNRFLHIDRSSLLWHY